MDQKSFRALLRRTLVIPFAALTILSMSILWEARFLSDSVQWVDHTDQVISASEELMKLALDMETGVRGYRNTGRSEFLQPYNEASSVIDSKFDTLNRLVADNPAQQAQLVDIRRRLAQWRQLAESAIESRLRSGQIGEVQMDGYADSVQRKQVMDSVRAEHKTFAAAEQRLRNERVRAAKNSSRLATILCVVSSLGIGLVLAAYTRRQMRLLRTGFREALEVAEDRAKALRESVVQFRTLADSIPQLAWIANAGGEIFWYNQRWYEYTGTTSAQMDGRGWQSVHEPGMLPRTTEHWNSLIATGESFDMVCQLRGSDGVFRPFLTAVMAVRNAQGKIARWFGTNTDISEQRQAEAELRKSKARLDLAIADTDPGEWELDLKDHSYSCSLRHSQIFGYNSLQPKWTYEMFLEHVLPQHHPEVEKSFKASLASGAWDIETQIRRVDGEVRWIWIRGRSLMDEIGQPIKMFGTAVDITDRKQATQRIFHLASFSELSPYPIFETNLEGKITYINPAALRQFPAIKESEAEHLLPNEWSTVVASFNAGTDRSFVREG